MQLPFSRDTLYQETIDFVTSNFQQKISDYKKIALVLKTNMIINTICYPNVGWMPSHVADLKDYDLDT